MDPSDDLNQYISKSEIEKKIVSASNLFQKDLTIRRLLEALAEGVILIDKSGTILLVNKRTEQIFGFSKRELVGKHHNIILPSRFHGIHDKYMKSYFKEPKVRPMGLGMDLVGLHKNGKEFPVEISLSYVETPDTFYVISFVSDITFRKKAETDLKEHNESLDAFAHTLAHDIRNSVAIITGFGNYINESITKIDSREIIDLINTIVKTGDKINHIIEGLLFFSTISKEDVPTEVVDSIPIIYSVIDRLTVSIKERGAKIIVPDQLPKAIGYQSWIEEIWFNYISNAIKYGGTPPVIEIAATVSPNGFVTYQVKDNGTGIKHEMLKSIFNVYQSRENKQALGYGLGLSIVKRIVEKLHGFVDVENRSEGGSVFSFSLPGG